MREHNFERVPRYWINFFLKKKVFGDPPPTSPRPANSRKTAVLPKVIFQWWAVKSLETLWFASAFTALLLPLKNCRGTEEIWNSQVLPYQFLSRYFVVMQQVMPTPPPSFPHFASFPIYIYIYLYIVFKRCQHLHWNRQKSVPTLNSVFGNPHGMCHTGYAVVGTHADAFSNCGRVCRVIRIPLGWLWACRIFSLSQGQSGRVWAFPGGTISNRGDAWNLWNLKLVTFCMPINLSSKHER